MNYDEFEPTDIGRCGEPYAPLPVCGKTYGLMAHGFVGVALAGEVRPPNPWNSFSGIEVGGRLEWRYDRFSFAITDFYGYNDGGYIGPDLHLLPQRGCAFGPASAHGGHGSLPDR